MKLGDIVRTPNHDAFGLAVVIFQLLWMGRHPFMGRYDKGEMPLETAIKEYRFVYSEQRRVGMAAPAGVPTLRDFPVQIGAAFETAFDQRAQRPRAADWVSLIDELERDLKRCASNTLHHYPRVAGECPWCRMERTLNVQLFLPPLTQGADLGAVQPGGVTQLDLAALWRAIEAVKPPPPSPGQPQLKTPDVKPSDEAQKAFVARWQSRIVGLLLIAAGVGILLADQALWVIGVASGVVGLFQVMRRTSTDNAILERAKEAERNWLIALGQWQDRCNETEFERRKESYKVVKSALESLPASEKHKVDEYNRNRRAILLKSHLDKYLIKNTKIKGIGQAKLVALTSYGIETAGDVSAGAVLRVPGFGPVNSQPLIAWCQMHEARFRYDPNPTPLDRARIAAIKAETARRDAELRGQLASGPQTLTKIVAESVRQRGTVDPQLQTAHERRLRALADLKRLRLTLPTVQAPPTSRATQCQPPGQTNYGSSRYSTANRQCAAGPATGATIAQGMRCPTCGSPMVARTARRGRRAGNRFWGCSRYPHCKGTRPF